MEAVQGPRCGLETETLVMKQFTFAPPMFTFVITPVVELAAAVVGSAVELAAN